MKLPHHRILELIMHHIRKILAKGLVSSNKYNIVLVKKSKMHGAPKLIEVMTTSRKLYRECHNNKKILNPHKLLFNKIIFVQLLESNN